MYTKNDFQRLQKDLSININKIILISPNSLERKDALGDLCFSDGLDLFENIISLFKELESVDLSKVPYGKLENIKRTSDTIIALFVDINNFSLTTATRDIQQERGQLLERAYQIHKDCFELLAPVILLLRVQSNTLIDIENNSKTALEKMDNTISEIIKSNKKKETEANQILDSMRKASA